MFNPLTKIIKTKEKKTSDLEQVETQSFESPDPLSEPLLDLSPRDQWTIRDACEGVQIFGGTGSGKTSGSGQALAKAFLSKGFGGLVLTTKNDELDLWRTYVQETDRQNDLIIFSPDSDYRFNFLDYELNREGRGAGKTENLVSLFMSVLEVTESNRTLSNDGYWQRTLKQLIRNSIDLILFTESNLTLPDIYQVIISAPQTPNQLNSSEWRESSLCARLILQAQEKYEDGILNSSDKTDMELTIDYFIKEFPNLAEKTRSVIVSTFTSMADGFLRGILRELFCTITNITPELTHQGKVIILDLPKKEYDELGQYAQVLFKYIWQRATERRKIQPETKPVFLWADESQFFVNSHDALFQSTARSSRACTVYLTQNLPNYNTALGDKNATESFLGNLQTKIFHANGDSTTNQYASELFSKELTTRGNQSLVNQQIGGSHLNLGSSDTLDYQLQTKEFSQLKKGGRENNYLVQAYVFQADRTWKSNGKNFLKLTFDQKLKFGY